MKKVLAILLFPFTLLYWLVTALRNHLYNINYSRSFEFEVPVIIVGNLEAGGTGKTPMIEYLIRLLMDKYQLATLSRGYGRKTKGFLLADHQQSPDTVGDEPYQFQQKFGDKISVAVGEERAWAIPQIIMEKSETQVLLLDDAFQHRKVKGDCNILLTRYQRLFYHDYPLPSGRLREWRSAAKRADAIIVSKCPDDLDTQIQNKIKHEIKPYAPRVPVFFSTVKYLDPVPVFGEKEIFSSKIILFTGLAHPQDLEKHIQKNYTILQSLHFPDHYKYEMKDLQKLKSNYEKYRHMNPVLLTTEKDMVKIKSFSAAWVQQLPIYYQPIVIEMLKNGKNFDSLVENSIKRKI